MNNSFISNLRFLITQHKPLSIYIVLNVTIFITVGVLDVISFLFKLPFDIKGLIWEYTAFPASIQNQVYKIYTLITYQFFHRDLWHLLVNMLTIFWFGRVFIDFLKPRQFHFVYLFGGFIGALFYAITFNLFPVFESVATNSLLIGASASVMAIAAASATYVPNYTFHLLLFGAVRLKYLVLFLLIFDIILLNDGNAGGNLAHLGGALAGFIFIKLLQKGKDLSKWTEKKPKLKVVKNSAPKYNSPYNEVSQEEIDRILEKISASGYEKLTSEEKQKLFKASGKK
ncbi:rhomboid family intramembrane serine protease [Pedobacter flavus]|uniref:Rhomboid family intramembrane serine protease n=1 Tax=Pedobacter flavus TaxID=3113906 RepID=A0ABU7GYH1_9SPHI|nr:rhomboid family intramembrane serine protease [Pedobacter sp. VNH31]MEE1884067.1 rhomboid family intramembrane serine protease [Pedobacter sp. VNH31]